MDLFSFNKMETVGQKLNRDRTKLWIQPQPATSIQGSEIFLTQLREQNGTHYYYLVANTVPPLITKIPNPQRMFF